MIGIYKITSPTGRIYIGQSINLLMRFKSYKKLACKSQPKLYNSFIKHGFASHKIEVLEFCETSELNNRERHYQDLYNTQKSGLNCRLTDSLTASGKLSKEHREKIGIANSKRIYKESTRLKKSKLASERVGKLNPFFGRSHSAESINKIINHPNRIFMKGENHPMFGKKHSKESREKNKISHIGKRLLGDNHKAKLVLDTEMGIYYTSAMEVALMHGVNNNSLSRKLRGERKNNTKYIYA